MAGSLQSLVPDHPLAPVRVVIVDDSVVVRGLFARWLAELPDIEVVGIHRNGLEAVRQVGMSRPDVVLLDIEMPEMDGLTALPLILSAAPGCRVLVVSGFSLRGADLTLRCLMRGASDYLAKPGQQTDLTTSEAFRQALVERITAIARRTAMPDQSAAPVAPSLRLPSHGVRPSLLLIGASTGGPQAITALLQAMRPALSALPVMVVQPMPELFTRLFADHLQREISVPTVEISGGELLLPGVVHVCRGGGSLAVARSSEGLTTRRMEAGESPVPGLPSLDVALTSAAEATDGAAIGMVLTGMGSDGVDGALALARAGGTLLVQNEATSTVWELPGAVVRAGAATYCDDLPGLARQAMRLIAGL